MAALNSRPRSPRTPRSRLPCIELFGPLRFYRSKFFTFKHGQIDIPLQVGPVTRAELSHEVHIANEINYNLNTTHNNYK